MGVKKVMPKENNDEKLVVKKHLLHTLETMSYTLFFAKVTDHTQHRLATENKKTILSYSFTYLLIYFMAFILAFKDAKMENMDHTFYSYVRYAFNVTSCTNTLMLVILGYFVNIRLRNWFNSLASIDANMEKHNVLATSKQYQHVKRTFGRTMLIGLLIFTLKISFYVMSYQKPISVRVCVALYHLLKSLFKIVLVFCIIHLSLRFQMINQTLTNLNVNDTNGISLLFNNGLKRIQPSYLDRLCKFHFKLCYLTKKLSDLGSFYFLYCFMVSMSAMLFFSYYIYHGMKTIDIKHAGPSSDEVTSVLFGIAALFDECFDCWLITKNSELLYSAISETPVLLHELRNRIQNREWDEQILINSVQFLHQKVIITAMGYFDISFRLLHTMAELVSTYLVLFIQHDEVVLN